MDREVLAHFLQQRHGGAAPGRPGERVSPVLDLVVEHLSQYPQSVEVLLQTGPAIALFGDHTRGGGSSRSLVDRWLSGPSAVTPAETAVTVAWLCFEFEAR